MVLGNQIECSTGRCPELYTKLKLQCQITNTQCFGAEIFMISTLRQSDLTDYYNTTEVKTYPKIIIVDC